MPSVANPVPPTRDEQREHRMVQVAKLYYDLERTQSEIAEEVGLTRWQVSRLLRDARETGIVRIAIVPRAQRLPALESRLQTAFGLREAIVVPSMGDGDVAQDAVAQAAGQYLAGLSPRPGLVGVSWGRTMASVAHWLAPGWNDGVRVVLMNGATNLKSATLKTNTVAERFAEAGNGTATLLPVPAIVGRAETRSVIEADPVIASVLKLADEAPVACFGLGGMAGSVHVESGYLTAADVDGLVAKKAVGDLLGRFIDADGAIADPTLDARTIGLAPERLRAKSHSIGVASGRAKHAVVLAALKARYVNVLVTDEATALHALSNQALSNQALSDQATNEKALSEDRENTHAG
ncbi:sugar-binding transcriptional regulator [Kaistia nematophila]|uniref:Sugar-binding transcriptional regulator n=1 Tax=Kaistia nematophila TaxID=2994654 RepID=A0A9X3DY42_9HYPH|nr:sugar-binding transcriptional regulator [Kaistia nematophila]MCX5568005.1 sugar-binding transcriptional regulator [Kaistia nematophila]